MKRKPITVALAAFGLSVLTSGAAGATTLSGGSLGMTAGDQVSVACAGHSLGYTPADATTGTLSCAGNAKGAATFVQAAASSPGTQSTSLNIPFGHVSQGDLLVGWFAQFNAPGQVSVSDNVDGRWMRTGYTEKFANGSGDVALFYTYARSTVSSLTITTAAPASTWLPYAVAEYSGIPAGSAPVAATVTKKDLSANSSQVAAGPTANVPAGDLVVGAELTGNQPASLTVGSTQGVHFTQRAINSDSGAASIEDVLSGAAGGQNSSFTISSPSDWYSVVAVFAP